MNLPSSLYIPQDVFNLIIEALANQSSDLQSRKTLTACFLVSSAFWQAARSHVFKNVVWKEPCAPVQFQIFEDEPLPNIQPASHYIREISILVSPEALSLSQDGFYDPWVQLSHILNRATNLGSLSLESTSYKNSINWNQLHPSTKDAIRNTCQSLTTLRFRNISNFPLALIADCVGLRELHIIQVDIEEVHGQQCDWNQKSLTKLETLRVSQASKANGVLSRMQATPAAGLSKLKHLKYRPSARWMDDLGFIRRVTGSLECLCLADMVDTSVPLRGVSLSEFPALRFLCVRSETVPFDFDDRPQLPTPMLNSLITDLAPSSTTSIEEIRIEFLVYTLDMPVLSNYQQELREGKWADIDKALTGPQYPFLRKVHIAFWDIYVLGYRDSEWKYVETEANRKWFQKCARRILPRTHASSIETQVEQFTFRSTKDPNYPAW